ncbi:hypothetical protein PR048_007936 [Dryococelus australis]|uniref:Uncharacterized protein n=1 Tax=Dryococelus australis TaxID=614101 RepID=A0ABQ9HVP4_9NEOP|nr:hypothetical protein PR048_007936 [Dryococelus australis]
MSIKCFFLVRRGGCKEHFYWWNRLRSSSGRRRSATICKSRTSEGRPRRSVSKYDCNAFKERKKVANAAVAADAASLRSTRKQALSPPPAADGFPSPALLRPRLVSAVVCPNARWIPADPEASDPLVSRVKGLDFRGAGYFCGSRAFKSPRWAAERASVFGVPEDKAPGSPEEFGRSAMSSYFANSYIPDLRNGGVVPSDHPHQHQHYAPAGAAAPEAISSCAAPDLRQGGGIPPHHYGGPGQPPQGMPYPRFPPYDRMDIRNAAYYQQGGGGVMAEGGGYRPGSPGGGMGHMVAGGGGAAQPNGHQTPVVYASCKLEAAAMSGGSGGGGIGTGSPPLEAGQPPMSNHNHNHQNHHHHPQHHMVNHQPPPAPQPPPQAQPPPQHHHNHQNHMIYNQASCEQAAAHHQGVVPAHQQAPPPQPPPQAQPPPQTNPAANLPSPLYPWMRSQFGE